MSYPGIDRGRLLELCHDRSPRSTQRPDFLHRPAAVRRTKRSSSAPISSAKARSARSFSVSAETGRTAPTTLTPFRSESTRPSQPRRPQILLHKLQPWSQSCHRRAAAQPQAKLQQKPPDVDIDCRLAFPGAWVHIKTNDGPGRKSDAAFGEGADSKLWTL